MPVPRSPARRRLSRGSPCCWSIPTECRGTIDEDVYGHFLEHINHSVVDGLYAEQIRGQGFEGNDFSVYWKPLGKEGGAQVVKAASPNGEKCVRLESRERGPASARPRLLAGRARLRRLRLAQAGNGRRRRCSLAGEGRRRRPDGRCAARDVRLGLAGGRLLLLVQEDGRATPCIEIVATGDGDRAAAISSR